MPDTQTIPGTIGRLDLLISRVVTGVCTASQDPAWMSFERRYRGPIKELATRYFGPLDGEGNVLADADDGEEDEYEYEYHDADCTCGECEEDEDEEDTDDDDYEEPEDGEDDDSDSSDSSDSDVIDADFEMVEN